MKDNITPEILSSDGCTWFILVGPLNEKATNFAAKYNVKLYDYDFIVSGALLGTPFSNLEKFCVVNNPADDKSNAPGSVSQIQESLLDSSGLDTTAELDTEEMETDNDGTLTDVVNVGLSSGLVTVPETHYKVMPGE